MEGFEINIRDTHVCRLKKALYGLKQAPRASYARMQAYILRIGFVKCYSDANLYIKVMKNEPTIILLYVDDLFIRGVERKILKYKKMLTIEFGMKYIRLMNYYLILEVWKKPDDIYPGQGKYIIKMLHKSNAMDSKLMTTPMITNLKKLRRSDASLTDPTNYHNLLGSLMYLVNTRIDICFTVNVLSQFQLEPRHDHWLTAKHILRYLCGTIHHCLKYHGKEVKLTCFTDSDWGKSETNGRSTIGGCFNFAPAMIS